MTATTDERARLREYLLGALDPAAAAELEERYFRDAEAFDLLQSVEDDLTDAYVRNELSPDERRRFERLHLRGASGQARVEFARALGRATAAGARPARPPFLRSLAATVRQQAAPFQVALAAGVMLLLIGPTLALTRVSQLGRDVEALRAELVTERAASRAATEEAALERARRTVLENTVAGLTTSSFTLLPGTTRGGGDRLTLPPGVGFARLELAVEHPPSPPLHVAIHVAGGAVVWSAEIRDAVGPAGPVVIVPTAALPPGEYQIVVTARGPDGQGQTIAGYAFSVTRR